MIGDAEVGSPVAAAQAKHFSRPFVAVIVFAKVLGWEANLSRSPVVGQASVCTGPGFVGMMVSLPRPIRTRRAARLATSFGRSSGGTGSCLQLVTASSSVRDCQGWPSTGHRLNDATWVPKRMTSSADPKQQAAQRPPRGPARVLSVLDQRTTVELVKLTLNHGMYVVRNVASLPEVETALPEWQPHLILIDMDLDGARILQLVVARDGPRLPVIGLTHRGDLKTKLAAFDAGVDDILTVPFSPRVAGARHRSPAPFV